MKKKTYNSRYLNYCLFHGKTPKEMMAYDRKLYRGGIMAGYITWISKKWREWELLAGRKEPHFDYDHVAFDIWLTKECAPKRTACVMKKADNSSMMQNNTENNIIITEYWPAATC